MRTPPGTGSGHRQYSAIPFAAATAIFLGCLFLALPRLRNRGDEFADLQSGNPRCTIDQLWARAPLERCHLVARADGGTNELDNLVLLCNRCHRAAPMVGIHWKPMVDWINRRELYFNTLLPGALAVLRAISATLPEDLCALGLSPEEFLESFNELVAFLKLGYHPGGEMMPTVAVALNALVQLNGTIQKFHRRKTAKRETVSTIEEEIQNTALLSTTTFCRLLAAFERALIIDRVTSGIRRSRADYVAGRIGKTKHTRSGKDLPTGRPRRIFRRDEALALKRRGKSLRAIAAELGVPHTTIAAELRGK